MNGLADGQAAVVGQGISVALAPLALLGLWAALVWPVLERAVAAWSGTEELQFGFLLPPVVAVLVWYRRAELARSRGKGVWWGLVLASAALLGFLAAEWLHMQSPAAFAAGALLWSGVVSLWGWGAGRVLASPLVLLTFGLSLRQTLVAPLAFALQQQTAAGAAAMSSLLGLPIVRDGLVLRGDEYAFVVTEACSGMSSLLALLALAGVWIAVGKGGMTTRLLVLASALPLAVAANTARVAAVLLVADRAGEAAALGFFHGASDLVLFGTALAGLLGVSRVAAWRLRPRP